MERYKMYKLIIKNFGMLNEYEQKKTKNRKS